MSLNLLNCKNFILKQLDWEIIIEKIIKTTHFDRSKDELSGIIEIKSIDQINENLDSLQTLMTLMIEDKEDFLQNHITSLPPEESFDLSYQKLRKNGILSLKELHHLAKHIENYLPVLKLLEGWNSLNHFHIPKETLQKLKRVFVGELRKFVDEQGNLDYLRHPVLKNYYEKLQTLEVEIRQVIKDKLSSSELEKVLQFKEYDVINDHYVIPIRSDSYKSEYGSIIGHSESGMTLYVEPFSVRKKCNQRIELLAKIDEIIFNICKDFSVIITPNVNFFWELRQFFIFLDIKWAKAKYSLQNEFCRPELANKPELELQGFFHPLIDNPIKNDFILDSEEKGVVISGPNTGGKTVALKSICMAHLFLHSGLYIPAHKARLHPFPGIFFFGNDQQNLSEGLSSFSAEVKNYLEVITHLQTTNLIFIDEIFNSTSSEEASALALALFEEIHHISNSKIIVSTHHQMLKTFIHAGKEYRSSHVGLDLKLNRPTYKIINGIPGSSMALTIFENLSRNHNITTDIVEKAKNVLNHRSVTYENLLQEVSGKKTELDQLLEENNNIKTELIRKKGAIEGVFKLKMQDSFKHFEHKMNKKIKKAENLIYKIKNDQKKDQKSYVRSIHEMQSNVNQIKNGLQNKIHSPLKKLQSNNENTFHKIPTTVEIGKNYYSTTLNKIVSVSSFNERKKMVTINMGSMSMTVPLSTLRVVPKKGIQKSKNEEHNVHINVSLDHSETSKCELDCRGMRLDEFQAAVEKALDDLVAGRIPYINVIHGHGEGTLKSWLRNYLKKHSEFKWEIPDHSADGSTYIKL